MMDPLGRFGGGAGPSPAATHQGRGLPAERVPGLAPSTSGSIGIGASARPFLPRARRALTVGAVALLWSSTSTSPALAHEFSIALVTAAGSRSSPDAAEVQAGWRLAVDQSPDVSHPAGPDAGDHLGGIDVRVTAVDGSDPAAAGTRIRTQLRDGVTVAVVIASPATEQVVSAAVAGTDTLLLTAGPAGRASQVTPADLSLMQRQPPGTSDAFTEAFRVAYGRPPTADAALGYDAGRLLDAAVAAAPDGVEDSLAIVRSAAQRSTVLMFSALQVAPTESAQSAAQRPTTPRDRDGRESAWLAGAALGALTLLTAAAWIWRRRRRTGATGP